MLTGTMQPDDLTSYLDSLETESRYRVDCVLKNGEFETTERVFLQMPDGTERGPYIRKFIARDSGMGGAYQRIFEANRAGRSFAHIPAVLECYRNDQSLVVVMEHVGGRSLADLVYERDPGVATAEAIFPALCEAVSELHGAFDPPVIHRDLKPSNVLVRDGVPFIIDFGIAREYKDAAESDTTNFGTRAYAPPEQFGYEQTSIRSDVYALGMLLYFLLVEQTPTTKVLKREFADARIPELLRRVIVRATAFDPQQRYASADELRAAFLEALREERMVAGVAGAAGVAGVGTGAAGGGATPTGQAQAPGYASSGGAAPEPIAGARPVANAGQVAGAGPVAEPSVPVSGKATPPAAVVDMGPLRKEGRIRNYVITVICAFFVLVSVRMGINPELYNSSYPLAFDAFNYLFFMPALFILVAFALMYKPRLRARFPRAARRVRGREKTIVVTGFVLLFFIYAIAGTAMNVF